MILDYINAGPQQIIHTTLLILVDNLIIGTALLSPTGFEEISVAASSPFLSVLIRHIASTGGSH